MAKIQKKIGSEDVSNSVDRISFLPKPMLDHVLSYIPTLDVVRTCVLSRQWREVWSSVPTLSFDSSMKPNFVKFVDSVLIQRDGSNLQRLTLSLMYSNRGKVNAWIIYALRHNVEAIDIKLYNPLALTPRIFVSESLMEFKMTYSHLNLPGSICLPALRNLHFEGVYITGQIDEAFFSAMPSLKIFIVVDCGIAENKSITVSACQLETLKIDSFHFPESIIIWPRMIKSLELKIPNNYKHEVTLGFNGDFLYLSDAKFDFSLQSSKAISKLIGMVKHAESLTLSSLFLSAFVVDLQKDISIIDCITSTQFPNLKRLTIDCLFGDGEILFINELLKHSPEIESVSLLKKTGKNSSDTTRCELYEEEQLWSKQSFPNLKVVEIESFQGFDSEVKMVQFLLENAICLKRLTITIAKLDDQSLVNYKEMMKIQKRISRHPRASSSAGIDFLQTLQ